MFIKIIKCNGFVKYMASSIRPKREKDKNTSSLIWIFTMDIGKSVKVSNSMFIYINLKIKSI